MPEIDLYHIDQITNDVKMQEIGFSHLFHDLVDHICCDVEYYMQQGMSFDEAYNMVKAKIGFRGLKKIQEDTLYVVDSKYRNMKKLMKISGVSGTIMLGFASVLKIAHLPLAGMLLVLGTFVLSFLFLPSVLVVLWKETKNQKKLVLFISAFIAGVLFFLGILFKVQHWPGTGVIILTGLGTGSFVFLPSLLVSLYQDQNKRHKRFLYVFGGLSILIYTTGFIFKLFHWPMDGFLMAMGAFLLIIIVFPWFTVVQWKNDTKVNARFIFMVIAPMLFVIPGVMINLNLQHLYDDGFFFKAEKQSALVTYQKASNRKYLEACKDYVLFQKIDSIHVSAENLISMLERLEYSMVTNAEKQEDQIDISLPDLSVKANEVAVSYRSFMSPFNETPGHLMLLPGTETREIIEHELTEYKKRLSRVIGHELAMKYESVLNLEDYLPGADTINYEIGLLPSLNSLMLLKSGILASEISAMKLVTSTKDKL